MAAYIPTSEAQDVVLCKYCQIFPAEFYCNDCGDELCSPCQDSHKTNYSSANHMTVSYRDRKTAGKNCREHVHQFYDEACKTCSIPICPECKVKSHYSHNSIDINSLCDQTKRKMKSSLIQMEKRKENVDFYIKKIVEVDRSREEVKEDLRKRAIAMKSCIDDILSASIAKIENSSTETAGGSLLKDKLEHEKKKLRHSSSTIQSVLKADPIDQVFYIKENPNWNKVSETNMISSMEIPKFEPKPLDQNDLLRVFGSLSFVKIDVGKRNETIPGAVPEAGPHRPTISESPRQSQTNNRETLYANRSSLQRPSSVTFFSRENMRRSLIGVIENPILVKEIQSHVNFLYHIAYNDSSSSVFISGHPPIIFSYKDIFKYPGMRPSPILNRLSVLTEPQGLTISKKNTIIYADRNLGVVEIHQSLFDDKEKMDKIKIGINARVIFNKNAGSVWGVHCTSDGNYLVCVMSDSEPPAVVRFGKNEMREFTHNSKEEELFVYPRYVCENKINQNICVSDFKKGVIVLTYFGDFLFNYRGNQHKGKERFSPRGIACDCYGRILVADTNNDLVHLLETNGEFITYILSSVSPVSQPWGLCVDSQNRLWIAERNVHKGDVKTLAKVKVFQIYKS